MLNGRSLFKHRVKRKPGRGSSSRALMGCFFDDALDKGGGDWLKACKRSTRECRIRWRWGRGIVIKSAEEIPYLILEVLRETFREVVRRIGGR